MIRFDKISNKNKEHFALRLSIFGSIFMTLLGIGFAILTKSEAILLDGLFSLITFIMGLLTLKVASLIHKGESRKFQFGYQGFEPFINTIRGLIILFLSIFILISSIKDFFNGGVVLKVGLAIVYAIIAAIGCFTIAFILKYYDKLLNSPLVKIDADNWLIGGLISSGVALAFIIAFFMKETSLNKFVPYVDPILVMILVLLVIKIPLQTIRTGINQLLEGSPNLELEKEIRKRINELVTKYLFKKSQIRMTEVGRLFYILIQIQVPETFTLNKISDLDKIRDEFKETIDYIYNGLVLDIVFTEDLKWFK